MEKQKICIIGGGLTGLVTAISLSKLDCEIDLVTDNFNKSLKSDRTIAISNNNLKPIHSAFPVSRSSDIHGKKSLLPLHLNFVRTFHR